MHAQLSARAFVTCSGRTGQTHHMYNTQSQSIEYKQKLSYLHHSFSCHCEDVSNSFERQLCLVISILKHPGLKRKQTSKTAVPPVASRGSL